MDIREFKNTNKEYAPSLIWDWCAKPTAEEIDARLWDFSRMGISSVFIRPSKGLVLPYLSEDYFELIRTAARRSGKYGITLYICDENSDSSGNGGGEITSVGDYRMRDFVKVSKNDIEKFDEVISESSDSAVVLRDMSKVRAAHRAPLADITDAFVTECFTDAVYEKYIRNCKRFMGIEIGGFLTSINLPCESMVYSPSAAKKAGETSVGECAARLLSRDRDFLSRYDSALSECIADNFTGFLSEKCRKNSLRLFTDVSGSQTVSRQMQYIKSDCITLKVDALHPDYVQIKLAESIGAQFEKPFFIRPLLPSFSPCSHRHNAGAFLTAMGADGIIYDSVAFSLSDRRKYEKHTVTVSKFAEKDISDRISRLSFVIANTLSAAKILVVYSSDESDMFERLAKSLSMAGIAYHMVEESVFRVHAHVSQEFLTIGKCEYDTVIALDKNYPVLNSFTGKKLSADFVDPDLLIDDKLLKISSDKNVIINRRFNSEDEYIFVTAPSEDTLITAIPGEKKLFAADSSNGELYRISSFDEECTFTLKAGKTVMLIHSAEISADTAPPFTDDIEVARHEKLCEIPFALSSADENILPLKNVNACFGRKSYRENSIDNLHREFYALADGETVKVKYPFSVDLKSIGEVKAYIENADNLEFAELNGKRISDLTPSDKDPRFMGTDVTKLLADGKNTLALEYKKSNNYTPDFASFTPSHYYSYNITSFEPVYLCGDFDAKGNSLVKLDEYASDITKSGMAYYYGSLTYAAKLPDMDLSGVMLAVDGDFDICRIKIGKRSFTFFSETPLIEVFNLDCGAIAEITVYNTPYNLLRTSEEDAKPFGIEGIELCKFSY